MKVRCDVCNLVKKEIKLEPGDEKYFTKKELEADEIVSRIPCAECKAVSNESPNQEAF